jgi:hypothetical protein
MQVNKRQSLRANAEVRKKVKSNDTKQTNGQWSTKIQESAVDITL